MVSLREFKKIRKREDLFRCQARHGRVAAIYAAVYAAVYAAYAVQSRREADGFCGGLLSWGYH